MTLYAKKDYLTEAPYAELYAFRADLFAHKVRLEEMAQAAAETGFKNFKQMYLSYVKEQKQRSDSFGRGGVTQFTGQPLELETGPWRCDDFGVTTPGQYGEIVACAHPILPVCRLVNVDTGAEHMELAYRKGTRWRRIIVEKKEIASARSIVELSNSGIAVTSESAKTLVQYLHDIEQLNYDILPEKPSVGRLGYIPDRGFSPYIGGLTYDGADRFGRVFRAIRSRGDREQWLERTRAIRAYSVTAKVVIAASFASVLIKPCGALPFFVHLWGATSGIGKSVALMAAASVWGDPEIGTYIQTFNGTDVGFERHAAFLNSLPLLIDEMQLARDKNGRSKFSVYQLAEGVGRTRGNRTGGVEQTPTWNNCCITSGETPLTQDNAGAGAKNRVIDIECNDGKVIEDGPKTAAFLRQNYGFAGREFVHALLCGGGSERAVSLYKEFFRTLCASDATEKQAMAAALLLTADALADEWIFHAGNALSVEEISAFLKSSEAVDVNRRAYAWVCDWVSQNSAKFKSGAVETYGVLDGNTVWVIRSVFCRAVDEEGYSSQALLSWLKRQGLIKTRGKRATRGKRINGILTECVVLSLPEDREDCPF